MPGYRYPWPASAISPTEMAILHRVRESSRPRVPITRLIAQAIRHQYSQYSQCSQSGQVTETAQHPEPESEPQPERSAA